MDTMDTTPIRLMTRDELMAFLGPAADEVDEDQVARLLEESHHIDRAFPREDQEMLRQEMLGAAIAYLLADTTLESEAISLAQHRTKISHAYGRVLQVAKMMVQDEGSAVRRVASRAGIDRENLAKYLGAEGAASITVTDDKESPAWTMIEIDRNGDEWIVGPRGLLSSKACGDVEMTRDDVVAKWGPLVPKVG